jgi:hypothetical protein
MSPSTRPAHKIQEAINDGGAAAGQEAVAARAAPTGAARGTAKATCAAATRRGATRAGEVPCAGAAAGQAAGAVRGAAAGQAVGAAVSASAARAMDTTPASASVSWASVPWSGTLPHLQHGPWTPFSCVPTDAATNAQPFIAGLGAPTTFTGGAGWPDWWTGAAKAALGPN